MHHRHVIVKVGGSEVIGLKEFRCEGAGGGGAKKPARKSFEEVIKLPSRRADNELSDLI